MMRSPVLFLVFNRPEPTRRVFQAIRDARPSQLFVAADGPRSDVEGEELRCEETRQIVEQVDWLCEVKFLFRDENLGCRQAVSSAITWFFEHVESGVILEDDCLPSPIFFTYCDRLLEQYRHHENVMMIGGSNFLSNEKQKKCMYYFSQIPLIWGWATWRRAWTRYDHTMHGFKDFIARENWRELNHNCDICCFWMKAFCQTYSGKINTWDYCWVWSIFKHEGITVLPGVNLVKNIGFGVDATHTTSGYSPELSGISEQNFLALMPPEEISVNVDFDNEVYAKVYNAKFEAQRNWLWRQKKILRRRFTVRRMMQAIIGDDRPA